MESTITNIYLHYEWFNELYNSKNIYGILYNFVDRCTVKSSFKYFMKQFMKYKKDESIVASSDEYSLRKYRDHPLILFFYQLGILEHVFENHEDILVSISPREWSKCLVYRNSESGDYFEYSIKAIILQNIELTINKNRILTLEEYKLIQDKDYSEQYNESNKNKLPDIPQCIINVCTDYYRRYLDIYQEHESKDSDSSTDDNYCSSDATDQSD